MSRRYALIEVEAEGFATRIALNNPARKNAIGPRMINELLWALDDAVQDEATRVIVLTGRGEAFCAGGDFSQMSAIVDVPELASKGDFVDLLRSMWRAEKPIVASVNGLAMGGGLGLVAACHFAVGADHIKLATPEINVGLFPMMIMAVLQRHVPRRKLLDMMLLGDKMSAAQALEFGLLSQVVAASELDEAVATLVARLSEKSPTALRLGLRAFSAQDDLDLDSALPMLRERLGECLGTEDAREGLTAFLQKRPPIWTGR